MPNEKQNESNYKLNSICFLFQANNGLVHSTIGMVERVSDVILCTAETIYNDDNASTAKKTTAATAVVPYFAMKYSATCVKKATDFAVGGMMKLFK